MVNIEFLVISYFVGLFVDWVFQSQWQAMNKSRWKSSDNKITSLAAVVSHSVIYALITTICTILLMKDHAHMTTIFIVLFVSHAIIDTRIPVKIILRLKGMSKEQINDIQNFGFMHIGMDHRLHEAVLLVLSIFIH